VTEEIDALPLSPQHPCILDGSRLETLDTATVFVLLSRLVAAGYTRATVSMRQVQERHARLLLVNDAAAFTAYRMAVAALVTSRRKRAAANRWSSRCRCR